jgi:hypothetical protein
MVLEARHRRRSKLHGTIITTSAGRPNEGQVVPEAQKNSIHHDGLLLCPPFYWFDFRP